MKQADIEVNVHKSMGSTTQVDIFVCYDADYKKAYSRISIPTATLKHIRDDLSDYRGPAKAKRHDWSRSQEWNKVYIVRYTGSMWVDGTGNYWDEIRPIDGQLVEVKEDLSDYRGLAWAWSNVCVDRCRVWIKDYVVGDGLQWLDESGRWWDHIEPIIDPHKQMWDRLREYVHQKHPATWDIADDMRRIEREVRLGEEGQQDSSDSSCSYPPSAQDAMRP